MNAYSSHLIALWTSVTALAAVVIDYAVHFSTPEKSLTIRGADALGWASARFSDRLDDALESVRIFAGGRSGEEAAARREARGDIEKALEALVDVTERYNASARLASEWTEREREFEARIAALDAALRAAKDIPATARFAEEVRSAQQYSDRTAGAVCRISRLLGRS